MDLFGAAAAGNIELLKALIDEGANVNSKHETQETPLMLALENVSGDCVTLSNGSDVNGIDDNRESTEKGNLDTSLPLIDKGADVKEGKHVECVKLLLNHGTDVNQVGIHSECPLVAAVASGNNQCISLFMQKGAAVNQMDDDGSTALYFAKDIELVEILVSAGADVNHKNFLGKTTLFYAQSVNIVKGLVAAGAGVNEKDHWGQTALIDAHNEDVAQALIEAGGNVNIANKQGETALFRSYNERIVKHLVEAGIDVNIKNRQGETALFRVNNEDIVKDLSVLGADVNRTNHQGQAPLSFVYNAKVVKSFVAAGADVNTRNKNGKTALFEALLRGRINVVKALLEAGADVNHRDNNGCAVLVYLVNKMLHSWDTLEMNNLFKCVKILLRAGLKVNISESKMTREVLTDEITVLLFAAGEESCGNLPDYFHPQGELILKHLCKKVIRRQLVDADKHTHLFSRVAKLGLPKPLQRYLLYNQTLDDDACDNDIGGRSINPKVKRRTKICKTVFLELHVVFGKKWQK